MAKWLTGTVIENRRWTKNLTSLKVDVDLGPFKPGQFVQIGLELDGEILARPYSLVNTPAEPLEVLFNLVPEGPLSPHLFELQPEDDVFVSARAAGFMTVNEVPDTTDLWMMATGTAVGPFLSMLKSDDVWQRFEHVILVYSARTIQDLAYTDQIAALVESHEQLSFVPIVTREDVGVLNIRIPQAINNGELEKKAGVELSADNSHVMLCGSSEMIQEVSSVLEARNMRRHRRRDPGHFTSEKYH